MKYNKQVELAMKNSKKIAIQIHSKSIRTEHLFMAMIDDEDSDAYQILRDMNLNIKAIRDIVRIKNFILVLELAKIRIIQKTYGICRVTGKLIPKDRLRSVPHATTSIEAKRQEGLLPKAKKTDTTTDFHSM